jgi:hypothetical protein
LYLSGHCSFSLIPYIVSTSTVNDKPSFDDNDRAIRCYRNAGCDTLANEIYLKQINKKVDNSEFLQAANDYENYANLLLDIHLLRPSVHKYLFLSLLCHMASISKTNIIESTESLKEKFKKYKEIDPQFNEFTREHILIEQAIISLEEDNLDNFESACSKYAEVCSIDKQKKFLFNKCKEVFSVYCNDDEDCR